MEITALRPQKAVKPLLSTEMKVDLIISDNQMIAVAHDDHLEFILKWIEYDPDTRSLTMIYQNGVQQGVGIAVPSEHKEIFETSTQISAVRLQDGQVRDLYLVPLIKTFGRLN